MRTYKVCGTLQIYVHRLRYQLHFLFFSIALFFNCSCYSTELLHLKLTPHTKQLWSLFSSEYISIKVKILNRDQILVSTILKFLRMNYRSMNSSDDFYLRKYTNGLYLSNQFNQFSNNSLLFPWQIFFYFSSFYIACLQYKQVTIYTGCKRTRRTCLLTKTGDNEGAFILVSLFLSSTFEFYSVLLYLLRVKYCSRHFF